MCGIIAIAAKTDVAQALLEGLRRLEYRGYDSAGLVTLAGDRFHVRKAVGSVDALAAETQRSLPTGVTGIGHTRWATHGAPTLENAHPHLGPRGDIAVVHNGVVENFAELRNRLLAQGATFASSTDTEVIAHLVEKAFASSTGGVDGLVAAVASALEQVEGTYGLAVLCRELPGVLVAARRSSPMRIGVGDGVGIVASDAAALTGVANRSVELMEGEIAVVTADDVRIQSPEGKTVRRAPVPLDATLESADRGEYPHFMLKEIFMQPFTVENTLRGRLNAADATAVFGAFQEAETPERPHLLFAACGSSRHAALVTQYFVEQTGGATVEVDYASEFRYRERSFDSKALFFAVAQSGETADTLAALRDAKARGLRTFGIVNVVDSTIAREAGAGIYLHAGPEIGVAATKTFLSQLTVGSLLALHFGRKTLPIEERRRRVEELRRLPDLVEKAVNSSELVRSLAEKYVHSSGTVFLGRGPLFPIALEGALKWNELTYRPAQAFPSGEIKHGPLALIDETTFVVALAPKDRLYEKSLLAIQEVRARGGKVLAIGDEGDLELARLATDVLYLPPTPAALLPHVAVVFLQLLAYHAAVALKRNVDKPRNLAKSVTVE